MYYRDRLILKRAEVPVLNVLYEGNTCGPYRDWLDSEDCFQAPGKFVGRQALGLQVARAARLPVRHLLPEVPFRVEGQPEPVDGPGETWIGAPHRAQRRCRICGPAPQTRCYGQVLLYPDRSEPQARFCGGQNVQRLRRQILTGDLRCKRAGHRHDGR